MIVICWILFLLVLTALLYLLSLRCRWGNPKMRKFTRVAYAHRGLHGNGAPENSLSAFQRAAEAGFGAELDVHLSKDGKLVVMHDENLLRTVGIDENISNLSSKRLEKLTLSGSDEPIPYLDEVLTIFEQSGLPVIIELKPYKNRKRLVKAVLACLKQYPQLQFCLESFDPLAMLLVRMADKTIVRGQLSSNLYKDPAEHMPKLVGLLLQLMVLNFLSKPDFIAYDFKHRDNLSLRLCHWLYDVQEVSWTVRNRTQAAKALRDKNIVIFEGYVPATPKG